MLNILKKLILCFLLIFSQTQYSFAAENSEKTRHSIKRMKETGITVAVMTCVVIPTIVMLLPLATCFTCCLIGHRLASPYLPSAQSLR